MYCLLAAFTANMGGTRFPQGAAVSALRDRAALLIDVLKRSIGMLAVTNTMTSHACLARILLTGDQHVWGRVLVSRGCDADGV